MPQGACRLKAKVNRVNQQSKISNFALCCRAMTDFAGFFRLDEKVALVTGGYGGIGSAVSKGLAAAGARVAVAGRDAEKAQACAKTIQDAGGVAEPAVFDALSAADTRRMVDEVAARWGRLDILVNTVGGNQRAELADDVTEDGFGHVINLNLTSAMFQSQASARYMIAGGRGGKQVHIGSVRSLLALRGKGFSAYCAAKGGLSILCKQLAAEWAPHNITVNMVSPTFVRTPQGERFLTDPAFYQSVVGRIPLGRIGETEDVVGAVLFFVSPASSFVTGQTLYLDGGITATQ
jgi:NAD(P)-dependent dehydrogenase (short-subunit alcohol dehydrogenase family)